MEGSGRFPEVGDERIWTYRKRGIGWRAQRARKKKQHSFYLLTVFQKDGILEEQEIKDWSLGTVF